MYHGRAMKKTLHLYLFREIAGPFFLGMGVFTLVLLMGKLIKLAEMVVAKGVPLLDVLQLILSMLPSFFLVTIPMAFLLALLLAIGRLSADSEITAIKACGISLYGLLPPVLSFAFLAYLATTLVTVYALPWGNEAFKQTLYNIMEAKATLSIKEQVFDDKFKGVVLYVDRHIEKSRTLTGVLIQDERKPEEPSTIFARSGEIVPDKERKELLIRLRDGAIHRAMPNKGYRLIQFGEYDLTLDMERSAERMSRDERDMTISELRQNIAKTGDAAAKRTMLLEYHKRFSFPFACFVFALVGVPLGVQNQRSGRAGGFSMSIALLLAYYILLSAGQRLGGKLGIPPGLSTWGPNIFFLFIGGRLFFSAAMEKPATALEFLRSIAARIKEKTGRRRP